MYQQDTAFLPDSDQYTIVAEKIKTYFSHSDVDSLLTVQVRAPRGMEHTIGLSWTGVSAYIEFTT